MPDATKTLQHLEVGGHRYDYYSLSAAQALGLKGIAQLPHTLKVVLESVLRHSALGTGNPDDIEAVAQWLDRRQSDREIGFKPARVLMVDSSGVPLMGDMAAMRDAVVRLGGDPRRINPAVPVDFVIDHSVMADHTGTPDALERNMQLEFERNRERYSFLRWGAKAFDNVRFLPPGTGICHQINLEYLARVVWTHDDGNGRTLAYPDSVLGMDSHTPMINSLGIVGWGVGGLEGGTAALGEAVSMLIPEVIGVRLTGKPTPGVTTTDVVLTITQILRKHNLIGTFVEYFGPGVDVLTAQERSTLSNMTPEYGATMGFFAVDAETLRFLRLTGRPDHQIALVEAYAKAQGLWRDATTPIPAYTRIVDIDLSTVEACVAGPRRPHERISLAQAPKAFRISYPEKSAPPAAEVKDGDVIIAAITSCTNTSNPAVMVGAGLLAKKAVARGLAPPPTVKTSLSPGSRVVTDYLDQNGLLEPLAALGFTIAGYGCMTCMGNSGSLADAVATAVESNDVAAVAVLSGNRNFEGRIHPNARANFLASPPLVVAYALAGTILKDLTTEPIGVDPSGTPVYLHEIWPDAEEIRGIIAASLTPDGFAARYRNIEDGTSAWRAIESPDGTTFRWDQNSSFILRPPFFDDMTAMPQPPGDIRGARVLAMFGDMLTTDHISPIGAMSPGTPAARYLESAGIARKDFVNYASRRLNHEVMIRGTFANIRIRNEMTPDVEGSCTRHMPSGERMTIFDAAERYRGEGVPVVVIGGSEYGAGSSRDWAAKGARLLGVRAIIAESIERIHRSNLVGMGVLPLQFAEGTTRKTLKLDGSETFDIAGLADDLMPRSQLQCTIRRSNGSTETIAVICRLDTREEVEYYRHGGLLHYVLRQRLEAKRT